MKKVLLIVATITTLINLAYAQPRSQIVRDSIFIPPLNILIDSAISNSALYKARETNVDIYHQQLKIEKKNILYYVYVESSARYGQLDQYIFTGNSTVPNNISSLTKNSQTNYYVGINFKIPISSFISRKNNIKIQKLNMSKSQNEANDVRDALRLQIIDEYYKLKYLEESMNAFVEIYQTLNISLQKAEKDVINGQMRLSDFALLTSTVGKSKDDYYKAKNSFYAQYYRLQELTGINFSSYKK